jgi:ribA/ribD-fused uncharacterized protein
VTAEERLAADGFEAPPVLFYRPGDDWGWLSNFWRGDLALPDPFTGERRAYPTGEHRYQAMKATDRDAHDWVAAAPTPGEAKDRGRAVALRDGWGERYGDLCYLVMLELVLTKGAQYPLREALAATGERGIYEDSPTDDIWGWRCGADHRGRNLLGRCWMQARHLLA